MPVLSVSKVLGIDVSLTSTGLAGSAGWTDVIKPAKLDGVERMAFVRARLADYADGADLVVIEGPSFGSIGGKPHERAGLWWQARLAFRHCRVAVVSPSTLKKYATGSGRSDKDAVVLAAARRFPWFDGGNDEADALWLCAMGCEFLGEPMVTMPAVSLAAMAGVKWPDSKGGKA